MTRTKSITKNYMYALSYQVILLFSPLVVTPYVSRVLGATGIGIYSYVQSIATYFCTFGAIGSSLYAQREIARNQDNLVNRSRLFFEILFLRIITVSCNLGVYLFAYMRVSEYSLVAAIFAIDIFAVMIDISWLYQGMEEFKLIVTRNILIKLLGIALIFLFVKSQEDLRIYAACHSVPVILGNFTLWANSKRYCSYTEVKNVSIRGVLSHFKPVLILFVPVLASQIYTVLDKTMLGLLAENIDQVGFYEQAQKIIKIALMSITTLGTVLLPRISKAIADNNTQSIFRYMKKSFALIFALGFPIMFGIIGIASKFVPWFYGEGFKPVEGLLILLSPIVIIIGLSSTVGYQYMIAARQQKYYSISIILGALTNIILNFVLIPKFQAIGAILASLAAELMVTAIQLYAVKKMLPLLSFMSCAPMYFTFSIIMAICVYLVGTLFQSASFLITLLQVVVGILIYILILLLTKDPYIIDGINMLRKRNMSSAL